MKQNLQNKEIKCLFRTIINLRPNLNIILLLIEPNTTAIKTKKPKLNKANKHIVKQKMIK